MKKEKGNPVFFNRLQVTSGFITIVGELKNLTSTGSSAFSFSTINAVREAGKREGAQR